MEFFLSQAEFDFVIRKSNEDTSLKLKTSKGFPGGAVDKNLPTIAGDRGSSPGLRRSHMPWGNWTPVPQLLKTTHLEPMLRNKRSHCKEKPAHCNQE